MQRWLEGAALGRPELRAWATYDWANSAFWLTVITTVFPIYYGASLADGVEDGPFWYTVTTTGALVLIAVLAPLLGTYADVRGSRKSMLAFFVAIGVAATAGLFFCRPGDWELSLVLFGIANIGVAGSVVFYDALLPHVARPEEMDRLSTSGFALGYVGSVLLLAFNLACILRPAWFGLPSGEGLTPAQASLPTRIAFLSVALWWGLFTLPLLRRVAEPPPDEVPSHLVGRTALGVAFGKLRETFRELRRYPQALRMLFAFLIFNDGIATLIRMAALYATDRDMGRSVIIGSILLLNVIGVPFAILFGQLARRFGPKRMILSGLGIYTFISVFAYYMKTDLHFVTLAVLVGTVQGGTQGLSRSLFASLIPRAKSGEFFALFAVGEKFAGIAGPAIFALCVYFTGDMKPAILTLIVFFAVGGLLLTRVDVAAGRREAAG